MPLPLPNLDTRRFDDLVEEARSLIPRYAPEWNDHNIHDPGMTLLDLLSYFIEQQVYRVNRVPEPLRRKFLELLGYPPLPPAPAVVEVAFAPAAALGTVTLPAGTMLHAAGPKGEVLPFRLFAELTAVPVSVKTVQAFDGGTFTDASSVPGGRAPVAVWGADPSAAGITSADKAPALYVGFDAPLPVGVRVALYLWLDGQGASRAAREQIEREAAAAEAACRAPARPACRELVADGWCADEPKTPAPVPPPPTSPGPLAHHDVGTRWEYFDGTAWKTLAADTGEVVDHTRGLSLSGPVLLQLPAVMQSVAVGSATSHYLRCRLTRGAPDAAPRLAGVALNVAAAAQAEPATSTRVVAPGATVAATVAAGKELRLRFEFDADSRVVTIADVADEQVPVTRVWDYAAPAPGAPGSLTVDAVVIGSGTGQPSKTLALLAPGGPVAGGELEVWSAHPTAPRRWRTRRSFDASGPGDADVVPDATRGTVTFGNGRNGLVLDPDAMVLARWRRTEAAAGNVAARALWSVADVPDNRALLAAFPDLNKLMTIANPFAADGGRAEETLADAMGRAASALWSHERLLDLPADPGGTLDQLDPRTVVDAAHPAPGRATNLLDYERLARGVPGTRVARARAWAGFDPAMPCLQAPGTVTVLIAPELPPDRPQPSPGLLRTVRRFLGRRRIVGTRLVVAGPTYVEVSVRAEVRAARGHGAAMVREAVVRALNDFLHPLRGGPAGRGWPFGRDVYRAEVMRRIDAVAGVDHVLSLALAAAGREAACSNICVARSELVTPGVHAITVS